MRVKGVWATVVCGVTLSYAGGVPGEPAVELSPWHAAVKDGDVAAVRKLLRAGADVNARVTADARTTAPHAPTPLVPGATAAHIAADRGSPELLDVMLAAKPDLAAKDKLDRTPMYFAARRGDVAVLERLVKAGAKLDDPVESLRGTAVSVAADAGKAEAVKWLVTNGADVNGGRIPALFSAVALRDFALAEWLVEHKADLKRRVAPNQTPGDFSLMGWVVSSADAKAVTWLLDHGDDPLAAVDNTGLTPWARAAARYPHSRDPEEKAKVRAVLRVFIDRCTPEQLDRMLALHDVVRFDLGDEAKALLKRGVAADAKDKDGRTALHVAALGNKPGMAGLLAAAKADLNPTDDRGLTPLLYATEQACRRTVVESGLLYGGAPGGELFGPRAAKPKPIDFTTGEPPEGAAETLRALLKAGADPQRANAKGVTPLHLAATIEDGPRTLVLTGLAGERGGTGPVIGNASYWIYHKGYHALPVIDVLLDHRAKVNARTKHDLTPLDVAATPAVRARLAKAGGESGLTGLAALVAADDLRGVRKHDRKADFDAPAVGGFTPLTWALFHRQDAMVPVLLKHGADPARRDAHGLSPVWLALSGDRPEALAQLLTHGASAETPLGKEELPLAALRVRDYSRGAGTKPLAVAVRGRLGQPDLRLVRLLLAFDADPNITLDDGGTPLHHAAAYNDREAARLLLDAGAKRDAKDKTGRTPVGCLPDDADAGFRDLLRIRP